MGRPPKKTPGPVGELVALLGDKELATRCEVTRRTIRNWTRDLHTPRGPAWVLLQQLFKEHGISTQEGK